MAYDHRGTGGSPPVDSAFTIADLADDAAGLLEDLGWERPAVFGVSLGGAVALELALRYPDRVSRLVLGCTTVGGQERSGRSSREVLAGTVVRGDPTATAANLFRMGVMDPAFVSPEAWSEYRDATVTCPVHPRTTVLQAHALARSEPSRKLSEFTVPTLVVHGDSDRIVEVDEALEIVGRIHQARLSLVRAGHFFWLEDPDLTARLVADWCLVDAPA